MKITIDIPQPNGSQNDAQLFNTVKRFQEDLLKRFPQLAEVKLMVAQHSGPLLYPYGNTKFDHTLNDDKTRIDLKYRYRNQPSNDTLERELMTHLRLMLQSYY